MSYAKQKSNAFIRRHYATIQQFIKEKMQEKVSILDNVCTLSKNTVTKENYDKIILRFKNLLLSIYDHIKT